MMKTLLLLLSLSLVFSLKSAHGQPDPEVFKSTEFVWCGLDYSNVKCIGPDGFTEPDQIKNRYFDGWNELVLAEADKYDLAEAYQKSTQITDLSVVNRRNKIPQIDELVIDEEYEFSDGRLKSIIADYDLKKAQEGLGLVYVVEALNKTEREAAIYMVFFDITTKDILWANKYTAPAGGFGFRNYWARAVYETIKTSGKAYKKELRRFTKGK